ncbi:MAG: hypothetical protein Q4C49_04855 [Bacillota bacterium]|nr:hypothetical protein [Bacillota bacterium]
MKKLTLSLLSAAFLLTGCSGANASIQKETGKEVIMTIGSTTITKQDEYDSLKAANVPSEVLSDTRKIIYNKEIKVTDEIKKEANEQLNTIKEMYGEENVEETIKAYGYDSVDAYLEDYSIPAVQSDKLVDKYIKENWQMIKKDNKPTLARVLYCDDEGKAKEALDALKKGEEFAKVFEKYSSADSTFTSDQMYVSTASEDLPTRLINTLYKSEVGIIDEVFTNESSSGAYVAVLESKSYKDMKQEVKASLQSDTSFSNKVLVHYLKKYNFEIYDQYVFDYFRANTPEFIVSHPELAKEAE